jgi:hypothetical protein
MLEEETKKRGLEDRVVALRTGERLVLPDGADAKPWVSNELPPGKEPPPAVTPPPAKPATPKSGSAGDGANSEHRSPSD